MSGETPQYNPRERLPFGARPPETPEFKAATAKLDQEMEAARTKRQKEAEMKKAVIIPPEQAAAMRAEWDEEIKKTREKIQKMH